MYNIVGIVRCKKKRDLMKLRKFQEEFIRRAMAPGIDVAAMLHPSER